MRFVSHEVRTPLNSVNMGLMLLQEELTTMFSGNVDPKHDPSLPVIATLGSQEVKGCETDLMVHAKKEQAQDILNLSRQILGSATNAIDVLNDVLNYDKIETGQLQLEKSVLDIWSLIDSVMHEFEMPFQAKGIHLVLRLDDKSTNRRVVGDAMKINQVFRNLLSNALKFTPESGKF
jgi:signal transduction histidine kinase